MYTQLVVALLIFVLLVVYRKLTEHMKERGIPIPGEEDEVGDKSPETIVAFRPHRCSKGTAWMPTLRTRSMKVGQGVPITIPVMDPFGMSSMVIPNEVGVIVCEGVFCSACQHRLACRCGNTPTEETIFKNVRDADRALACCDQPLFGESDIPDSLAPLTVGKSYNNEVPKA